MSQTRPATPKEVLHRYLKLARQAMLWKLESLSEYDIRRPLTPTGTNLLGLVKHLALVEYDYLGTSFGRIAAEPPPWDIDTLAPNHDLFATDTESRAMILDVYQRSIEHSDATIEALPLDAEGHVAWWPDETNPVTLHWLLVHLIAETNRHAGHADIVRELIDGEAGLRPDVSAMPDVEPDYWPTHVALVEQHAQAADPT